MSLDELQKQIETLETRLNTNYIELRDEIRQRKELQVRFALMEKFIKDQNPEFFAGEAETEVDPALKPIVINYGEPVDMKAGQE